MPGQNKVTRSASKVILCAACGIGKRVSRVFALLLFVSSANAANDIPKSTMYPPKPPLPPLSLSVVDRLAVNVANLERNVTFGKSEQDGITEIKALLKDSRFEEIWAFVPGDQVTDAVWFEIGRDIEETVDGMAIRVDRPFLRQIMRKHSHIHLYHFHPLTYFERCPPDMGCGDPAVPRHANQVSRAGFVANMRYAMPSPEDIYFMMDVSWEFNRIRGKDGEIRHRVVTPYGVVEYALTAEGQARFDADRNLRTGGLYIALVAGNVLLDETISAIVDNVSDEADLVLKHLIRKMNSRNLRVTQLRQ